MTFGYLGYIWAILGCSTFGLVFLGSAGLLYSVARRGRAAGREPVHTVEALSVRPHTTAPRGQAERPNPSAPPPGPDAA